MTCQHSDTDFYDIDPLLTLEMARFRLTFTTQVPLEIRELAPIFRSRLGYILKGRFCPFPDYGSRSCDICSSTSGCLYIKLFAPTCDSVDKTCKGGGKCHTDPPRPYGLDVPAKGGKIELTLLGKEAIQNRRPMLESLFHAAASLHISHVSQAPENSDLPDHPMAPLSWQAITPEQINGKWQFVYEEEDQIISRTQGRPLADWVKALPTPDMGLNRPEDSMLELQFRTPFQLDRVAGKFTFTAFLQSIISRLRDLKRIYHPDNDMGSFPKKFYALSDKITTFSNLERKDFSWYSHHRQKKIHLGGLAGNLIFKGDIAPFLPVLAAGFLIGMGKKTVYGLGRFDLSEWTQQISDEL